MTPASPTSSFHITRSLNYNNSRRIIKKRIQNTLAQPERKNRPVSTFSFYRKRHSAHTDAATGPRTRELVVDFDGRTTNPNRVTTIGGGFSTDNFGDYLYHESLREHVLRSRTRDDSAEII